MIITLLTDFGGADTWVGQVKGAILGVARDAKLVDLTHEIPAQDVASGAFHLWTAVEVFPAGTIHVAVVDPGVGSARRAIAVRARRGDVFVGPDNGLLTAAIERLGGLAAAVVLDDPSAWRAAPSSTFHGRDIFGPVAGHLAAGRRLETIGHAITDPQKGWTMPPALREGGRVKGEVVHVDRFGNLITSIAGNGLPPRFSVDVRGKQITGAPQANYASVEPGGLLAVIGSAGLLEVSVREGSAAEKLKAKRGDAVTITLALAAVPAAPDPEVTKGRKRR